MKQPKSVNRDERGVSLIEAMIGLVILAVVLLGLAGSAGLAMRQTASGRQDMQMWAAVQWTVDSLFMVGAGNVTNGQDVVHGFPMKWTTDGATPERIVLEVNRVSVTSKLAMTDTVMFYLSVELGS